MATSKTRSPRRLLIAAVAAFIVLAGAIDLWRRRAPAAEGAPVQLTRDSGLTTEPALSPDGKLVAYASDRAGGVLEIWVQPTTGGESRRLTNGDADSHSPAFSHDGARIAFRSERNEGGIYVVPARGGEPVLAAEKGRDPRFSPDGKWLAWWSSPAENSAEVYVAPAGGGEPRRIAAEFRIARYPVWSPDGRHLLFYGDDERRSDWFVVPAEGGQPQRTGARAVLGMQELWYNSAPTAWARDGVFFSALYENTIHIWRIPLSPGLPQFATGATRVTSGATRQAHPSLSAGGEIAWAESSMSNGAWTLPLDPATGLASGEPVKLAEGADGFAVQPSVSADGRRILFRRKGGVWIQDTGSRRETELKIPAQPHAPAVISPDGTRVLYAHGEHLFSAPVAGGEPQRVCQHCWEPESWSADGARILYRNRGGIALAYTASCEKRDILRYPRNDLRAARFSPDGRWIAVHMRRRGSGGRRVWIAPYREGPSPDEGEWIAVTGEDVDSRNPCWSADGNVIYYIAERDGFRCIWGQRLERGTRRLQGEPFAVRHFHQSRYALTDPRNPGESSMAAARDRLVFTMFETTGNVWHMKTK